MVAPTSRRERKKQETRDRILSVAGDLLASQGFESTTLDQIAESADVSKATFYNYFPNKDALLQQIAEIEMADIGELLAVDPGAHAGPLAMIKRTLELLYSDSSPVMIVVRHVLLDVFKKDGEIPAPIMAMSNHSAFLDLVQRAKDEGELHSDLDVVEISRHFGSAYLAASVFCKSVGKDELELSEVASRLVESAGVTLEEKGTSSKRSKKSGAPALTVLGGEMDHQHGPG